MSSYTKLFSSIIHSSVWQLERHVKIVWVTMLAMKDRDGVVEAAVPGLAAAAGVTIAEAEQALALFMAPDVHSRTETDEGRRVKKVPGGWYIINHDLHNDRSSADDYRAKNAARQQRLRDAKAARSAQAVTENTNSNVTSSVTHVTSHAESREVTPSTLLFSTATDLKPAQTRQSGGDPSLRFPDTGAQNFSTRDLERAVSEARGTPWRIPTATYHRRQAADTAAEIMDFAATRNLDPYDTARRACAHWLTAQKSVDPMVWCANWAAALPPPSQRQEAWRDLEG